MTYALRYKAVVFKMSSVVPRSSVEHNFQGSRKQIFFVTLLANTIFII